jgi:nitrate reductase NapAB chaperone NapD
MAIASVIVEIEDGASETVLGSIAQIAQATVYGIKENQIVTVIEGGDSREIDAVIRQLSVLDKVIGVYPVYAGDYE